MCFKINDPNKTFVFKFLFTSFIVELVNPHNLVQVEHLSSYNFWNQKKLQMLRYSLTYVFMRAHCSRHNLVLDIVVDCKHHTYYVHKDCSFDFKWPLTYTESHNFLEPLMWSTIPGSTLVDASFRNLYCIKKFYSLLFLTSNGLWPQQKTKKVIALHRVDAHYHVCSSSMLHIWVIVLIWFADFDRCWPPCWTHMLSICSQSKLGFEVIMFIIFV